MSDPFHRGNREMQDRHDSRRLADRLYEAVVSDRLYDRDVREMIERADMFFLATADAQGRPNCSYKGGDPGFVRVLDESTLAFPHYDGNGLFLSLGNVLVNPQVGLLFVDFEGQRRLRVNGTATVSEHDALLGSWAGATAVVRVSTREVFINCKRYVHKYRLVERSEFVPRPGVPTPTAPWKSEDWAAEVLPAGDTARKPGAD